MEAEEEEAEKEEEEAEDAKEEEEEEEEDEEDAVAMLARAVILFHEEGDHLTPLSRSEPAEVNDEC